MTQKITLLLIFISLYSCSSETTDTFSRDALSKFDSKVFEVSTKNAIIVWDEAKNLNAETTHYSIILNNKKIVSDLEGVTYSFENLKPKTTYKGIIKAEDQTGNQSIASFTFKTSGNETLQKAAL